MSSVESFLNETLGAAFIGFAFSCLVLGILLSQTAQYLSRYPNDKWINKALVAGILVLELGHQGLVSHSLYYYNILNFAKPTALSPFQTVVWSIIVQQTVGSVIGVIVKMCFAARVWRFSNNDIIVCGILVALNITELGLSIAFTCKGFQFDMFADLPQIKTLGSFALGCGALNDLLLAASLCFYLERMRSKQRRHYYNAHSLITMLSIYAVGTGMMTSAVGIATLLCYYFMPLNFIFIALFFVLSKLYGVSLLAALNTRQHIEPADQSNVLLQAPEGAADSLTSLPLRSIRRQGSYSRHHRVESSRTSSIRSKSLLRQMDLSTTRVDDQEPRMSSSLQIPQIPRVPKDAHSWGEDTEANISRFSHLTE
ncbi:hypothetical protein GYMLUDRAFT_532958 [Collybiopsis luxurians FD-317 M1]|nr:hypothetical protein GYMLUDRAFT_532958 [Collybiopsis luxurians FD-317 M1]